MDKVIGYTTCNIDMNVNNIYAHLANYIKFITNAEI